MIKNKKKEEFLKKSSTFFLFLFRQNTRESQYFVYRVQNPVKRDMIRKI